MAKYRHRTFEMFEFYDEAVATLNVRPRKTPRVSILEANAFEHLSITQSENFVRIAFNQPGTEDDQSTCIFRDDFSRLADLLQNDSRVIIDFEGVKEFSAASLETLEHFYQRLTSKGSRLVLCNLEDTAKLRFFPARVSR